MKQHIAEFLDEYLETLDLVDLLDVQIHVTAFLDDAVTEYKKQFYVGDEVQFKDGDGVVHKGSILRKRRKKFQIANEDGTVWDVYPALLFKSTQEYYHNLDLLMEDESV